MPCENPPPNSETIFNPAFANTAKQTITPITPATLKIPPIVSNFLLKLYF